jgi:hypothetical protein
MGAESADFFFDGWYLKVIADDVHEPMFGGSLVTTARRFFGLRIEDKPPDKDSSCENIK